MKNLQAVYIEAVMYRKISLAFHIPVRSSFVINKERKDIQFPFLKKYLNDYLNTGVFSQALLQFFISAASFKANVKLTQL